MKLEDIKDIRIEDFDYPLPDERIAKHPLADRDSCKLLMHGPSGTSHHKFSELPDLLPQGSLLVMNNTRVINARMEFFRQSGARIEIFLLEPLDPRDYAVAFQTRGRCSWQCLVGNLKKWKDDHLEKTLEINPSVDSALRARPIILTATRHKSLPGNAHAIEFTWDDPTVTFASIVEAAGNIPIPPYLNRKSEASDSIDYQTVYSRIEGSVAAPTAGLHFTPELLDRIREKGIETREVTLHVGAGTFQPVKSEEIGGHPMHRETFEISFSLVRTLRQAIESGRKIVAVGTTTVRTLESLPLLGIHLLTINDQRSTENGKRTTENEITQWEAYTQESLSIDTVDALQALEQYMENEGIDSLSASTSIMIAPGFRWRIVDGMVTNFHQPQSTLLLLVSSLLDGDNLTDPQWRRLYQEALDHGYRFLSYGDACLFLNSSPRIMPRVSHPAQNVINIPGSKSIAARALVCRLLGGHDTVLTNLPDCGDTRGMLRLTEAVRQALSTNTPTKVDIGEGGTTLRFGMAACASIPGLDITIIGSQRLMERPHATLIDALRKMGAELTPIPSENAIHIKGHSLAGGILQLDGSVSSQFLSALMLAAPTWESDTIIQLTGHVVSRPYIEMTARVMRSFGAHIVLKEVNSNESNSQFSILNSQLESNSKFKIQNSKFEIFVRATGYAQCARYDIEGDWSGASYFFETRLIAQSLGIDLPDFEMPTLKSPVESLQGDSRVAAIFAEASSLLKNSQFSILNSQFSLNLNDAPDLVPAIAVAFCLSGIPFRIEGVSHLRHKETDRMAALSTELRRLGYILTTTDDTMSWTGERCDPDPAPLIRTYQDHRMAMAFAPTRLLFPNLRIEDPTVVEKSFPTYWQELSKLI